MAALRSASEITGLGYLPFGPLSLRISLFIPCLVELASPATTRAARTILERLGHEVVIDRRQTCCGQALYNAGFRRQARDLAIRFVEVFRGSDIVVAPGGSCVSMVTKHYAELDLEGSIRSDWESLRTRVFELAIFLVRQLDVTDIGARFPHRVVYHPSCHYLRDLGEREAPLALLNRVEGLELVSNALREDCCGFGGAFSAKYPALADAIADKRTRALCEDAPAYITGVDDSCLNHLNAALCRSGSSVRTLHIARILAGA